MLFKMILDGASDDERHIAQGFLRHIIAGFAIGLIFGGTMFGALFLTLGNLDMNIPILFILAMLLQFGPIGGLIGAGVHVTRIADLDERLARSSRCTTARKETRILKALNYKIMPLRR